MPRVQHDADPALFINNNMDDKGNHFC